MIKLKYLREQAAAYLRDAAATDDKRAAVRLLVLAAHCQEMISELEQKPAVARYQRG